MRRAIWTRAPSLLVPIVVLALVSALSGAGDVAAVSDGELPVRSVTRAPAAGEVTPTVVALDAGAAALRPLVEKHLSDLIDLTGVQMGWRPAVPITVYVATDADVAVASAERIGAYAPYARVGI